MKHSVHSIHKGEVLFLKAINIDEVNVDTKGALRFREEIENRCVSFIHFTFSYIVSIWLESSMTTTCLLVRVCIGVPGVYEPKGLGGLMSFL